MAFFKRIKYPVTAFKWLLSAMLLLLLGGSSDPSMPRIVAVQALEISYPGLITVFHLGKEVVSGVVEAWDLLEDVGNVTLPFQKNRDKKILQRINALASQISMSQISMSDDFRRYVEEAVLHSAERNKFIARLERLHESIAWIKRREETMQVMLAANDSVEQLTLNQFALATVDLSKTDSIIELLHRIETLVTGEHLVMPSHQRDIFYQMNEVAKSTICTFGLSAQQVLYLLYEAIAMTELKGYLMMQFAYMVLRAQGNGNFTVESTARKNELQTRLNRTHELLQRTMEQTSRDYWRCDPERQAHRENETYLQFTRLLQGYIENEVDMNTENTCRETCAHYQYGHRQEQCYKELYCTRQPKCAGRIYDCEYVDSDMWICPSAPQSQRRYEYIEYENGMVRGRKGYCPRGTTKVDSWWRWIFWHCSYCFCVCDDNGPRSDRFVSLREAVSDIAQNKVVTGLRFVKHDRVIHLAVQQGTLMPQGEIDNRTLEWVPPRMFSVLSKGIRDGLDYHTLTYDNRSMDLDDVQVYPGYVLTGVRFRLLGTHLNLMIRMTEMNFTSGQLMDLDKSIWIGNDNTIGRTELVLKQPDVPTKAQSKSIPDSTNGQYIRFTPTDREADAAQTTVPFLDAQPVYTHRPVPLSGAGIFHKGQPKSGGFLAPKLLTYDFTTHIQHPLGANSELPELSAVSHNAALSTALAEDSLPSIN
uniref:Putative secreted protein n=2 Tax=Anopheles triannulatus TaxID=58253 RepID=A0A2M4A7E9_9DIPT